MCWSKSSALWCRRVGSSTTDTARSPIGTVEQDTRWQLTASTRYLGVQINPFTGLLPFVCPQFAADSSILYIDRRSKTACYSSKSSLGRLENVQSRRTTTELILVALALHVASRVIGQLLRSVDDLHFVAAPFHHHQYM